MYSVTKVTKGYARMAWHWHVDTRYMYCWVDFGPMKPIDLFDAVRKYGVKGAER